MLVVAEIECSLHNNINLFCLLPMLLLRMSDGRTSCLKIISDDAHQANKSGNISNYINL